MYTYHHLISRLTEADKIRLLTDLHSLGSPWAESLGLPRVNCASLGEGAHGDTADALPSPALLARSWDGDLMRDAAAAMTRRLADEGVDHILLPPATSAITPDGIHLSEDPHLSGELAGKLLAGVRRVGLTASQTGVGFSTADAAAMDTPPTPRFFSDHVAAPFATAAEQGRLTGVVLEGEGDPHDSLRKSGYFILRRHAEGPDTVTAVTKGEILLKGSPRALTSALHTYRRMTAAITRGEASTGELEEAIRQGEAMSPETLDAAVDHLLTFATAALDGKTAAVGETVASDALRKRVLDGTAVLLENRNQLLPLTKPTCICILGDVAREEEDILPLIRAVTSHGHTYLGYARGYDPAIPRNDTLTAEAATLAGEADTVLLYLQTEAGKRTLPAAQTALLNTVGRAGKKTVAILVSDRPPDMGFLRITPVDGLLLIPAHVKGAALHAMEILLGDRAPMGHLTETLTDASHPACDRRGYKIGPFVGYRYYDTVNCGAVYPFGHGLGYTQFTYSALKVDPRGTVTCTVKNTGKRAGVALPQIYVGMQDSAILRPKKELVGFARIPLEPGERRIVTLPWRLPPADGGRGLCEKGTYRLYVGESVSDIRLTADFPAGRDTIPPDGARLSDYLPSVTNIPTERYVLEAPIRPMKPSARNLIFGIAAIALAVSIKLYDILTVSGSVFLNIVSILLAIGAVVFFVMEITDRKRGFARERAVLEEANAALFSEAADIPVPSADALFELVDKEVARAAEAERIAAEEQDHFLDVCRELTLPVAARAVSALSAEKGLTPERGVALSILSGMASSRLVLTRGMDGATFADMMAVLSEYFGCPLSVDCVDATYTDEAAILYGHDEAGEITPRNALNAVEAARRDSRTIHLVGLTDVTLDTLSAYFVPYTRYARAPHSACTVKTHDPEGGEVAYLLPENLWFFLNLKDGESLGNLPAFVAEVSTLLTPTFTPTPPTDAHGEFIPFRYGQMLYLCDRLQATFAAGEDTWKRIDRLEAYAARFGDFAVTNKLWLGLETYLAALLTDEPDPAAALDAALVARLMPALIAALSGKLPREERSLAETLDAALGEGNATLCRRTVKESGADLT